MNITTLPTINRLTTVEEELTDRIFREKNGKMIFSFCEKLAAILMTCCAEDRNAVRGLRDKLSASLCATLKCSTQQAASLVDLATELAHVRLKGTYRSNVDLNRLIATATGAVPEVTSN